MKISAAAVQRPVMTTMVFLALVILGAVSFTRLRVDLLPPLDFPSISVVTGYPGAGPQEIETLITRPVEQAVATVEGIDRLESFSTEGRSRVALRFVWGTNLDTALNDVRAVVERAKDSLPEDADTPVVYKFNLGSFPILYLALSGSLDEPALRQLAERQLSPRLERVAGVARVDVRGGLERQIHVLLDPARLIARGLSATEVVAALREQNRNLPVGQLEVHDNNLLVRNMGEALRPNDLLDVVVATRVNTEGRRLAVHLRDIARVKDTFEDPSNVVHLDGQPGIRIAIAKQSGANTVEVAARTRAEIERINSDYHGRAKLSIATDTSEYIERSISNVRDAVLIGAALAVLVLLGFLRNLRSTAVVAISIPISIIGMFTLMYAFDITLNLVSFGGVALGIGLLVDNAIVILENIFRKLEEGLSPIAAAIEGANEVAPAILASTLTTVVVFLPVIFLTGFAAIFFGQMAFVVSFALVCSLAVALTLVPMLASRFIRPTPNTGLAAGTDRPTLAIEAAYDRVVRAALNRPVWTLLLAVTLLAASLGFTPWIGTELLPEGDQSEVSVVADLPVGTRIEVTELAARRLEAAIDDAIPEAVAIQTVAGTPGFWSTRGEETARIEVRLSRPCERSRSSEQIAAAIRPVVSGLLPGADTRVRAGGGLWIMRMLRGGGERLEVQVRGEDLATADRLAAQVRKLLMETEGVSAAIVSRSAGGRELRIRPNRGRIAGMGLNPAEVARQVQIYVQGTRATVLRAGGDEFDVIVRLTEQWRRGRTTLLDLPIVLPGGGHTKLGDIATVQEADGPVLIERRDQGRVVDVRAILSGTSDLGSITADVRQQLAGLEHPDDFSVLVRGERAEQESTFAGLLIGIGLAILLVWMVMAAQFESFLQPLFIMVSIPFAAIGVLAALALTGTTFNIQSFMGCIVLVGIVVNNAIVLIDYINLIRRGRGLSVRQAVVLSCKRRLRPIAMTTATTILALMPVAIGSGEGGEAQAPLARAVIGGLLVSSAISLVVIPVIYDAVEGWRARRAARAQAAIVRTSA